MKLSMLITLCLLFSLAACASGTSIGNGFVAKDNGKTKTLSDKEKKECTDKKGTVVVVDGKESCELESKPAKPGK